MSLSQDTTGRLGIALASQSAAAEMINLLLGTTTSGVVITAAGPIVVPANVRQVIVNKIVGQPTTVVLPAPPLNFQLVSVIDGKGDSATNNITITTSDTSTINGLGTVTLAVNYGSMTFIYTGSGWQMVAPWQGTSTTGTTGTIAAAGTTNANGGVLTFSTNLITGANGTKGVVLPVAPTAGQLVRVINTDLTHLLKVYADAGGTGGVINGGAANAAYLLSPLSSADFLCTVALTQRSWWSNVNPLPASSATDALTALVSGGQTGATPLTTVLNRFTTVANTGDSAQLPPSAPGTRVVVINDDATHSMNIFPQTGDQINAVGANNAFALAAGKVCTFYCPVAGLWRSQLGA